MQLDERNSSFVCVISNTSETIHWTVDSVIARPKSVQPVKFDGDKNGMKGQNVQLHSFT